MGEPSRLKLPDEISIANVTEWKQRFTALLEQSSPLILEATDLKRIDTAAVQMFVAFSIAAEQKNREVVWSDPSDLVVLTFEQLGLSNFLNINEK